jgi:hypothetical protein
MTNPLDIDLSGAGRILAHGYPVRLERDGEEWWVASIPALPGCSARAQRSEDAIKLVQQAVKDRRASP